MSRYCMLNGISLPDGLELRAAKKSDRAFMRQLFNSTREYLRQLPLPAAHIDVLLEQQYQLQQSHYARQWPNAETLIIQLSGKAIGKITMGESETALHIIDIAVAPAARRKGFGTAIIRVLQAAAEKHGRQIRLSVDRQNPQAKKLYAALGFKVTGSSETHEAMGWYPPAMAASGVFFTPNPTGEPVKSQAF